MKNNKIVHITLLIIIFSLNSFANKEHNIIGKWYAEEIEKSTIEIEQKEDGNFYGEIVASEKKEWIGKTVLDNLKYDSKTNTWKGEIYSLKRNMTIDVTLSLESEMRLKLVGKKLFMTKTFYWKKIKR